jgi:hypothetical protein
VHKSPQKSYHHPKLIVGPPIFDRRSMSVVETSLAHSLVSHAPSCNRKVVWHPLVCEDSHQCTTTTDKPIPKLGRLPRGHAQSLICAPFRLPEHSAAAVQHGISPGRHPKFRRFRSTSGVRCVTMRVHWCDPFFVGRPLSGEPSRSLGDGGACHHLSQSEAN